MKIESIVDKLIDLSKTSYIKRSETLGQKSRPIKNHTVCLELYKKGWKQDGFEHIEDSTDIYVFFVNGDERARIKLSLYEQQLWIRELDALKAKGEI